MATTKSMSFKGGAIAGDPTPIPVPADALFIVKFDETPASDIGDALHDKKVPCLFYNGEVVELFHASANNYVFRTTHIRNVGGENILDIVDYIVVGSAWSTSTKEISNGYESQAYLRKLTSFTDFDTTGLSGMYTVLPVNNVPNDGVYQVSVMMSITPKTASPTKSDLVFGFYNSDGIGMPDHTFHAVVDDSQTFAQQLSFSTTLNLKAGTTSLKMQCGGLNTEYLVFVDDLTVAQLVNGVYHNGDKFEDVHTLPEAADFNNDDGVLVDGATGGPRFMLWQTLANKVLGFIKSLSTTITAFRTGDVIPVDGPSGTAKMTKDDLLINTEEYTLNGVQVDAFGIVASGGNFPNIKLIGQNGKSFRVIIEKDSSGTFKFVAYTSVSGNLVNLGTIECANSALHKASAVITMPVGSNERLILNNQSGYEIAINVGVYSGLKKKVYDNEIAIANEASRATNAETSNANEITNLKNSWQRRHVFRYYSDLEAVVAGVYLWGLDNTKQYALRYYESGGFKTWQIAVLEGNWTVIANVPTTQSPIDGVSRFINLNDGEECGYIALRKEAPTSTTNYEELRVATCFDIHYNPSLALWASRYRKYPSVVEINVKTDGTGDYTKIKDALDSITDSSEAKQYVVYIHEGTYNIEDEVFGGDYSQQPMGLFIPDYVSLVGVGKRANIVIDGRLDSSNINISQSTAFSTINSLGNVSLENLTIYAKNCRYCWHSDGGWTTPNPNVTMKAKNCHFKNFAPDSTDATLLWQNNTAVGFGLQSGEKFIAERCVFETEAAKTGVPAYGSHNWDKRSLPPVPCIQQFTECEFKNTTYNIAFRVGYLGSETDDQVIINGCKFSYDGSNPNIWVHDEMNASIPCDYWLYLVANKQVHITADAAYKKFEILSDNS